MIGAQGARLSVLKLLGGGGEKRKRREPIYGGVKSTVGNRPASFQVHCGWPGCERHTSVGRTHASRDVTNN